MVQPERPIWDKADEIKEVEHKCDHLTHQIIQRLNSTFVTPIDREDIHALAKSLEACGRAVKKGVTVVRSSRVATGSVGRNVEVNDDELGTLASDELNPQKARILLSLALLKSRTPADIQKMFYEY